VRSPPLKHDLDHPAVDNRIALLTIGFFEKDHILLGYIFRESNWTLRGVRTYREATVLLRENPPPVVVICERDFADGNWKDILGALTLLAQPPPLIVTSRLADECLWAEVLNLGGRDVLAKPLDEKEVLWAVSSAWRNSERQCEKTKRVQKAIA